MFSIFCHKLLGLLDRHSFKHSYLSESGELYTFGESEGGKLGLGDDPDDTDAPQKVLLSEKVKSVACGGAHTVALTGTLTMYCRGSNGTLTTQICHRNHKVIKLFFELSTVEHEISATHKC